MCTPFASIVYNLQRYVSPDFRRLFNNEWIIFPLSKIIKYSVQYVLNILCSFSELC